MTHPLLAPAHRAHEATYDAIDAGRLFPAMNWDLKKRQLDQQLTSKTTWCLHDLRRTVATGMADLGVQPHVVEAALNHFSGYRRRTRIIDFVRTIGGATMAYNGPRIRRNNSGSQEDFSIEMRRQAFERAARCCEACKKNLDGNKWELDHIRPLAGGGLSTLANAQVLCTQCHATKTRGDYKELRREASEKLHKEREERRLRGTYRPKRK